MRTTHFLITAALLAVLSVPAMAGHGAEDNSFQVMTGHYLVIQEALAVDSLAGIGIEATALKQEAQNLLKKFNADQAGIEAKDAVSSRKILPQVTKAAAMLEGSRSLTAAREAFGQLSEAMVAYRALVPGDKPLVAYCPMAKKSWLQAGKTIANPYYGASMLRCGTIVQ